MKKRCVSCNDLFYVEANTLYDGKKGTFIGKGTRHKSKLCATCWIKARAIPLNRKGKKKYGNRGKKDIKINLQGSYTGAGRTVRQQLVKRDLEIIKLNKTLELVVRDNIRLKDELKVQALKKKDKIVFRNKEK